MNRIVDMMQNHPRRAQIGTAGTDEAALAACIEACFDCAQSCVACADACLGEENVQELVRCVRLNEDCATACTAAGTVASRVTETNGAVLRSQLQACATACRECAEECERHGEHMEHCRVCAEVCRACESACEDLLSSVAA